MNEFSRYLRFEGAPSFDLNGCDFVSFARGFGIRGTRVERGEDLTEALRGSFTTETPSLVEVVVEDPIGVIY